MKKTKNKSLENKKSFFNLLKNKDGQIALFFVFIFQLLFILLGMTINITLVVHDKINLQNSLDLAAYYGASKQAEVLNAMSHINYQMRQNYKLLAWRYRVLGSLTIADSGDSPNGSWCPKSREGTTSCKQQADCPSIYPNEYCDKAFSSCFTADIWGAADNNENTCLNLNVKVPEIPNFTVIAGFNPINIRHQQLQQRLRVEFKKACGNHATLNGIISHFFLTQFRLDQKDRKIMLQALYNSTLKQGRDLEGKLIESGVRKVFEKNLNYSNRSNYEGQKNKLNFFNSVKNQAFEEVFEAINIFPLLFFSEIDGSCSGNRKLLAKYKPEKKEHEILQDDSILELFELNTQPVNNNKAFLKTLSLGYYKKPSVIYYASQITLEYPDTIPPLFDPKPEDKKNLKASSFAKAFGGRFGPDKTADPIINPQILDSDNSDLEANPYTMQPNYSRYPKDSWGLIDKKLHTDNKAFLRKRDVDLSNNPYKINHLISLANHDPLSRAFNDQEQVEAFHFLRIMEMAAVFPDVFDLIHYSIFPAYMEVYFPKICKLLAQNKELCKNKNNEQEILISQDKANSIQQAYLRGDFGYPYYYQYAEKNKQNSKISGSLWPWFFLTNKNPVKPESFMEEGLFKEFSNMEMRYPYWVKDPAHFLTAWSPTTSRYRYQNYSFPEKVFSQCSKTTDKNPSACIQGGRSGHSVKMLSCQVVETYSKKPKDFKIQYCP